ncbi:uncharacterized protein N7529_005893 [Penicillium soppii]|jgi:hypothetical protein|uniref:uncharacterized protein n=1 Tax=Penicillium soppii TaxID=69789 RepID=UPI002546BF25|nr:uncharacterized protein N7529_005893 [Penicillium soppii]KAJ5863977.1 hypothetical protein N7529_005893 [Penicillium soppii]
MDGDNRQIRSIGDNEIEALMILRERASDRDSIRSAITAEFQGLLERYNQLLNQEISDYHVAAALEDVLKIQSRLEWLWEILHDILKEEALDEEVFAILTHWD